MNTDLSQLHSYPFQKLATLKSGFQPPEHLPHIALSMGEPKHPTPILIEDAIKAHISDISKYPLTKGEEDTRESIARWLSRRFDLPSIRAGDQILPVNGTREALFAFAQAVINRSEPAKILMPNPFYQIYEGAAFLAGAEPVYLNCTADNHFLPDFDAIDEATWQDTQLLFLCSPGNPTGALMDESQMQLLIEKAQRYDFIIASDECYSEIYFDEDNPPAGLLGAAERMGLHDYKNCVVFHSLSKRSNAPGLRSGFVAGDAEVLAKFLLYRTYHGCAMPLHHQAASIAAWDDEGHVVRNRQLYREKFAKVLALLDGVLDVSAPDAAFYLWAKTPIDDERFAQRLFAEYNLTVLPGRYLSREADGINPGEHYVRMALVAELDECIDAAERIKACVANL